MTKIIERLPRYARNDAGQVALIVLLISAVAMTLGLSLSKKTVIDTKVESDQQKLKQAFNAAESGVEYYLGTGSTKYMATDNLSRADVVVKTVGVGVTVDYAQYALVNGNVGFWLVGHNDAAEIDYGNYYGGSKLSFCVDSTFAGSMMINYFYLDSANNYKVQRYGYNYDSGYVGGFSDVSPLPGIGGNCKTDFREQVVPVSLGGGIKPLLITIKPLKTGTKFYLIGSGEAFPSQGISISSVGRVGDVSTSVSSAVNRTLNVVKLYQIPSFAFDAITTFGQVLSN